MNSRIKIIVAALAVAGTGFFFINAPGKAAAPPGAAKPALSVVTVRPESRAMLQRLSANGSVAAWQEASLGCEVNGLRLADVRVNVGTPVKRGQLLAEFARETPLAEQAQVRAALAEAEAAWQEAHANAERARSVEGTGAISAQQIGQYFSAEASTQARVLAAQANLTVADLRLAHTRVLASDDGVISFRAPAATLGAVVAQGQELFRLIRQNRLEWRAEVTAEELGQIRVGQTVSLTAPGGTTANGTVRALAPTVDAQTRNALVYVDLPTAATSGSNPPFKSGMFARGEFALGQTAAMTLPRQALVMRDGFSFVFLLGAENRIVQTRVQVGRRDGERAEITSGLAADAQVVAAGAGFLNDGDLVNVLAEAGAAESVTSSAPNSAANSQAATAQ
jgi:RND family efflux transporter MFP subunit